MADFNKAAAKVLNNEGGYSTDATDKGNYLSKADFYARRNFIGTKYGVAAPTLAAYLRRVPTAADMKALTLSQALNIYKTNYWDVIQGDRIANQSIADTIFDSAINHGTDSTVAMVQNVLRNYTPITVDGVLGPATLTALNSFTGPALFNAIQAARAAMYQGLNDTVAHKQEWLSRIKRFLFVPQNAAATFFLLALYSII